VAPEAIVPVPAADVVYPLRPPLPLPHGLAEEDLRRIMRSFSVDGSPPGALDGYVADSFERFVYTLGLTDGLEGAALELGANPYFMSYLLQHHTELVTVFANYFGDAGRGGCLPQTLSYEDGDGPHSREMVSHLFNLEEDRFPFADGAFQVVLFCEIIEHLLVDPTHPLREINRVLTTDGHLILTTPNMARLENVLRIVAGEGTGDPYSGNGPYGRHNREYTLHELSRLLEFCGFELEVAFTADSHRSDLSPRYAFAETIPLLRRRERDLGHYIFIRARKVSQPREGLPSFLFAAHPSERIVSVEL
jgi:SAM-dependent methyltransferase